MIETKHYVRITNLLGASFWGWYNTDDIAGYVKDRYSVEYVRATPRDKHKIPVVQSLVDSISDMCYSLVYAQYGYTFGESSEWCRVQADSAVFAMRDTLEIILESLGHNLLWPGNEAAEKLLDDYQRKQVMRMQTAAIMLEKNEAKS
jgi:hypothetical protein